MVAIPVIILIPDILVMGIPHIAAGILHTDMEVIPIVGILHTDMEVIPTAGIHPMVDMAVMAGIQVLMAMVPMADTAVMDMVSMAGMAGIQAQYDIDWSNIKKHMIKFLSLFARYRVV